MRSGIEIYVCDKDLTMTQQMDAAIDIQTAVIEALQENPRLVTTSFGSGIVTPGAQPLEIVSGELIDSAIVPGSGGKLGFLAAITVVAEVAWSDGLPVV
jgi:hypothetical protein